MSPIQRILHRPFFIRLFHWEFWSFNAVYAWIMPVWVFLSLRAKSFFFFSASNPGIEYGGFLMESKKKIYDILPRHCYPKTAFFLVGTNPAAVLQQLAAMNFIYPLIGKPDIGGQGRGVKKLHDEEELLAYAAASPLDYLVQECVALPNEVGIFYYRYPGAETGAISGIVKKELLSVTGDGHSSMRTLLLKDKRYILQMDTLVKMYGAALEDVLPAGDTKELVPYGNHARGAKFIDASAFNDQVLTKTIDSICRQVEGFYYGRLDIRFNTWQELREGKNISIIELNGAGSEPTHMYDPEHSLVFAWKEIVRHWIILWKISRLNHQNGVPYLTRKQGMQLLKDNTAFEQKLARVYV